LAEDRLAAKKAIRGGSRGMLFRIAGCDPVPGPWPRFAADWPKAAADAAAHAGGMTPPAKLPLPPVPGLVPIDRNGREIGAQMEIRTSRFGVVTVDEDRLMTFPRGLLGFPDHTRFALIQTGHGNYFFWLQSVDEPSIAFVVTDPNTFFKEYDVPLRKETFEDLAFTDMKFAQILVICNKVGDWLTGNLLGPIVVNGENRMAEQVVLTEKKWTTRQPLLRLAAEVPLAKSA
jgi:flagellar assembly factor FliW